MSNKEMEQWRVVDAHFHIWELNRFQYPWPTQTESAIFRNFCPEELAGELATLPVKNAVFIQCLNNAPEEVEWVLDCATRNTFIKGVVAGLDLTDPDNLTVQLEHLKKNPLFVGVRHILDMEKEDYITREDVQACLQLLEKYKVTFDLLVRPKHLKYVPQLGKKFSNLKMVVNHIAKPFIKDQVMGNWKDDITEVAKYPNICCKLSGLVTEADVENWKPDDFKPYLQHVLATFGPERCMFGSDWPVCKLAGAEYKDVFNLLQGHIEHLTLQQQQGILGENAIRFYNLKNVI